MTERGEPVRPARPVDEQLRDAAYTLIGAGVMAYKLSGPYRRRVEQSVRTWLADVDRRVNEGSDAQADRSRQ